MDNEARERLWNIAKRLVDVAYAKACDHAESDEEFQRSVDALVNHLRKVRRRSEELYTERQMV